MRRRRFFDNLTLPQRPLIPEWHLQQQKIFLPALLLPAPSATLSLNSIGKRGCPRKQTLPRIPLGAGVSTGLRRASRRVHFRLRLKCRIETVQENPPGFPAHTLSPRRQHSPVFPLGAGVSTGPLYKKRRHQPGGGCCGARQRGRSGRLRHPMRHCRRLPRSPSSPPEPPTKKILKRGRSHD